MYEKNICIEKRHTKIFFWSPYFVMRDPMSSVFDSTSENWHCSEQKRSVALHS